MSSPEGERSPKRQRRSYSPASPPQATDAKAAVVQPPQTPPPSVHMSPTWQSQQLPGLQFVGNGNGSGSGSGSGSVTFPTPPSTAGFQSHIIGRGASSEGRGGAESGEQTPAHEGESMAGRNGDGDGDAEMSDMQPHVEVSDLPIVADGATDTEHRRSDHERQEQTLPSLPGTDVLYKLHTQPIAPSRPHPTQNLLDLYSLQKIQSSVARRDPVTGEKINKLRKSYENKVRDLELEGRNKPTKGEKILEGLVDSGWDFVLPEGRSLWEGSEHCEPSLLSSADADGNGVMDMDGLLEKALDMRPGHLPQVEYGSWHHLLGLDELGVQNPSIGNAASTARTPTILSNTAPLKTAAASTLQPTKAFSQTGGAVQNHSAPASPGTQHSGAAAAVRPERAGKKRRYDESSYAGYQEGYEDDGYSTGGGGGGGGAGMDGRRGSGGTSGGGSANKRQKRKQSDFTSPTSATSATASTSPFNATANGSSNSMVGVRSS